MSSKVDTAQVVTANNDTTLEEGLGSLLYHVHSTHIKNLLCATETTSLQFYEHMVVATVTSQLWCFPKKYHVHVIPRFKIVNAAFSLGPRSIPWVVYLFLIAAMILIIIGAVMGGCSKCKDSDGSSSSYSYYSSSFYDSDCDSSGACACLVIGCLLLIPVILLVLVPLIWKWHFIYLDVKSPSTRFFNFGGITSYSFRFKKIGFDMRANNQASFDEFYLIEYVFGSLGKAGNTVTSEAHLLSHFSHAALATPIVPIHADNTVRDLLVNGLKHRKTDTGDVVYATV